MINQKPKSMNLHAKFFYKHFGEINEVSRKTKKNIIGKKMNKRKLKKRLDAVVVTRNKYPNSATISDYFCPRCGCDSTKSTGNMAEYPELYVQDHCLRCRFLVSEADNSPTYFALEFPEHGYAIN